MPAVLSIRLDDETAEGWDSLERGAQDAFGEVISQAEDATDAIEELTEAQKRAAEEAAAAQQTVRDETLKVGEELNKAAQGAVTFSAGLALLAASGNEDMQALAQSLAGVAGALSTIQGGIEIVKGLNEATKAARAAAEAQAAANAAVATSNVAVATTSTAATGAIGAMSAALLANPIGAILVGIAAAAAAATAALLIFKNRNETLRQTAERMEEVEQATGRAERATERLKLAHEELQRVEGKGSAARRQLAMEAERDRINELGGVEEIAAAKAEADAAELESARALERATAARMQAEQEVARALQKTTDGTLKSQAEYANAVNRSRDAAWELARVEAEHAANVDRANVAAERQAELMRQLEQIETGQQDQRRQNEISQMDHLEQVEAQLRINQAAQQELVESGRILSREWQEIQTDVERLQQRQAELQQQQLADLAEVKAAREDFFDAIAARQEAEMERQRQNELQTLTDAKQLEAIRDRLARQQQEATEEARRLLETDRLSEESAERLAQLKAELAQHDADQLTIQRRLIDIERERDARESERARRKAEETAQARSAKADQLKGVAGQLGNSFSQKQVVDQVAQNRIEQAGLNDQEGSQRDKLRARREMEQIRRQVAREARQGKIDGDEAIRATQELAEGVINQARDQGKISEQTRDAMTEAVQELANQGANAAQMAREIAQIQQAIGQSAQTTNHTRQQLASGGLK